MRGCVLSALLSERGFGLHTYSKATENKCHFLSHGLTGSLFPPPPSVLPSCFDPPNPPLPPSHPACPTSFLPRQSLSASQHIPPGGEGCLIQASSNLPSLLSLSLALSLCFLSAGDSVDSPLSYTSGLHYLPSSASSKMTL